MPEVNTVYIRGRELPPYLIKKLKIDPNGFFKITIEPQDQKPDNMETAFKILDEIHNKMQDEDPEALEEMIDEAVLKTRSYA